MFGALLEVDMFKKCTAPWREGCGTKHMSKSKSSKHTAFDFWDLRCFARHNGVHFFIISTSQSGPYLVCFVHFDFEVRFAPQRRALFDIATSKSGPTLVCFVHFDLETRVAPQRRALFHHLSASRLSYLFAHLHLLSSDFLFFDFFLLLFSSLTLPISAFHLSILSEV